MSPGNREEGVATRSMRRMRGCYRDPLHGVLGAFVLDEKGSNLGFLYSSNSQS